MYTYTGVSAHPWLSEPGPTTPHRDWNRALPSDPPLNFLSTDSRHTPQ